MNRGGGRGGFNPNFSNNQGRGGVSSSRFCFSPNRYQLLIYRVLTVRQSVLTKRFLLLLGLDLGFFLRLIFFVIFSLEKFVHFIPLRKSFIKSIFAKKIFAGIQAYELLDLVNIVKDFFGFLHGNTNLPNKVPFKSAIFKKQSQN